MRGTPAVTAALDHLRQLLKQPAGSLLPPVDALAASAGVSHPTMLKAVHLLVDRGVLTVRQGSRCRVGADHAAVSSFLEADAALLAGSRPRHRELRERFVADITRGVYQAGEPLPLPKELCARYGVCHRTLAQALGSLASQGLVVRHKRRYRLERLRSVQPGNTVVLFARGDEAERLSFYAPGEHDEFRAVERDCAQMGLNLHVVPCYFRGTEMTYPGEGRRMFGALPAGHESVLGFLLWVGNMDERMHDLLPAMLPQYGKPIAVLNSWRPRPGRIVHPSGAITRHFAHATGAVPGRDVGRYLFGLGHRTVAFLSPFEDVPWSQNRLAGLTAAMAEGSSGCTVRQFAAPDRFEMATIVETSPRIRRSIETATSEALRHFAAEDSRKADVTGRMLVRLRELHDRESLYARTRPVLEQAIGFREATAWVGANDSVALDALECLRQHGRKVPRDVSVIGFDDSTEASFQRLTSYSFNGLAVMRAMLLHVTDPTHGPAAANPSKPFEVPGFVTTRQTCGPAR
jgi:DNA-binding LacI/PurR family transcriptional regulator/DNA-binding transcriptional regulator YhcF (GntR family)